MSVSASTPPAEPTPPAGRSRRRAYRYDRDAYLYLLPVIISALVITILPFIYTAYISFTNYNRFLHFQHFTWVGLDNFKEVFARGKG